MNTNAALHINELRIGSIINGYKLTGGWHPFVVTGKDIAQFEREIAGEFSKNCPKGIDNIEPIPLTPEILEKCGFERTIGTLMVNGIECAEFYFVKHFYSKITQDSIDRNWFDVTHNYSCDESNEEELLCSVRHLHQLQNLYFALTGTELNVQL